MATTLLGQAAEDIGNKYDSVFGFAEGVTGPAGGFLAVFSNEYERVAGEFVDSSASAPFLRCRDADAMAKGAAVTVRTVAYVVVEVQPNGRGETIHRLQRA